MSTPGPVRPGSLRSEHCAACGKYPGVGAFCEACGVLASHPTSGDFAAPYLRRLSGELLDLLLFLLLPLWLWWMWGTVRDGQSPAKSLLGMYVVNEAGQPVTPQRMWMRELVIKRLLLGLIGYGLTLLGPLINAGWILMNPDRQCIHDRMVGTLVVVRRDAPVASVRAARPAAPTAVDDVRMPPPAPRGPLVPPTLPPTPAVKPEPVSQIRQQAVPAQPVVRRPKPAPTSPELEALEAERQSLSQTEYERQRRSLLKQLEDAG